MENLSQASTASNNQEDIRLTVYKKRPRKQYIKESRLLVGASVLMFLLATTMKDSANDFVISIGWTLNVVFVIYLINMGMRMLFEVMPDWIQFGKCEMAEGQIWVPTSAKISNSGIVDFRVRGTYRIETGAYRELKIDSPSPITRGDSRHIVIHGDIEEILSQEIEFVCRGTLSHTGKELIETFSIHRCQ